MKKENKLIIVIVVIGALIVGMGIFASLQWNALIEDDNIIEIPVKPTDGYTSPTPPPAWERPEMVLDSVNVIPGEDSADFSISVLNPESVINVAMELYVDGVKDSYHISLINHVSGVYETTIYMSQFSSLIFTESEISIKLTMIYMDDSGNIVTEVESDVVKFSFLEEEEPPPFFPPEIVKETFEYSIEDPFVTFGFPVAFFESVTGIECFFVLDGQIIEMVSGEIYVIDLVHLGSGYYQSFFDYSLFPLDVDIFLHLTLYYINENEVADSYIFEEIAVFNIPSGTEITGINYIYVIIATAITLATITTVKRLKVRNK